MPGPLKEANAPDAFSNYAAALARLSGARVSAMVYPGEDGSGTAPLAGTFGHFASHAAINAPLATAANDYGGDLPVAQQPRVNVPDPWEG